MPADKIEPTFVAVQPNSTPADVAEARLSPPGSLLDLINRDLRGQADESDRLALRSNPGVWLSALYSTLHSLDDQIKDRDAAMDLELKLPDRSESFRDRLREHRSWRSKVIHFRGLVQFRIQQVRELIPHDDLKRLLHDGSMLDPEDPDAIRAWQKKIRQTLG